MTSAVRGASTPSVSPPAPLAGWRVVFALAVRRERIPLLLWSVATITVVLSSLSAITSLYPDPTSRAQLGLTIATNPAFLALNGPLPATSVGGVTAWRIGVYGGLALGYLGASTVIRRTRAEEETGRAELLASAVLGRFTLLAAALSLAWAVVAAVGLACALGCVVQGQPVGGSLALGAALAGPGLVFSALAAVSAQVFESARAALSAAGLALGIAYALRAMADSWPSAHWLTYASPLGWTQRLAPYGANRWWVLLLFLGTAGFLAVVAFRLELGRDLGLGLFRARLGPAGSRGLGSGAALAVRLHRPQFAGWVAGLAVFGVLTGSLATTSGSLLADNPRIEHMVQKMGGIGRPSEELFAVMAATAGFLAAAYSVAAALRLRAEEVSGRAELTLSTTLSRIRLFAGHLSFSVFGSAALLVVAGVASGLVYGLQTGDVLGGVGTGLSAMAVQIPAVWVIGGLTAVLIGWLPMQAAAAWALLATFVVLGQLGHTFGLPRMMMDLSPFAHVPPLPTGAFAPAPVTFLTLVAAIAIVSGLVGYTRRDIG